MEEESFEMHFKKDKYPPEISYIQIKDSDGKISSYSFDAKLFRIFEEGKTTGTPMSKDDKVDFLAKVLDREELGGLVRIICAANRIDFTAVVDRARLSLLPPSDSEKRQPNTTVRELERLLP